MPDTLTTELEAVNTCLATIGEAAVNSLSGTLPADVSEARSVLTEVRRKVCGKEWWFNQDKAVQSTLDGSNEIVLATNVLAVELTYPTYGIDLVQRGTRLYNSFTQSYTFTEAPKLNITYLLDWAELPEQARQYVMHRAARIFQQRSVGAPELDSFATREELEALSDLKKADSSARNRNIFNGPGMQTMYLYRRR